MNNGLTSRHKREVLQDLERIEELTERIREKLKYRAAYLREQGEPNTRMEQAYDEILGAAKAAEIAIDTLNLKPSKYNEQMEDFKSQLARTIRTADAIKPQKSTETYRQT